MPSAPILGDMPIWRAKSMKTFGFVNCDSFLVIPQSNLQAVADWKNGPILARQGAITAHDKPDRGWANP